MIGQEPPMLSYNDIQRVANELNFGTMRSGNGDVVAIPRESKYISNTQDFSREWSRVLMQFAGLNNRPVQVSSYQRMDQYSPIVSRALDTYADEALGISGMFLPSVEFQINDKVIEKKVREVIEYNGLLTDTKVRADVRDMCKYGDTAYVFNLMRTNMPNEDMPLYENNQDNLFENIPIKQNRIAKPFTSQEIIISEVSPLNYSLHGYKGQLYQLTTDVNNKHTYKPWEFVMMSLEDKESFPYGRSVIEQGRIPFETLQVAEQLLAMARNSKVSRWVIRIPDGQSAMDDFEIYSELRASFENMRWGSSGPTGAGSGTLGRASMTRPSDNSLNTVLFVPKSLEFDELRVDIDVSDMEDIIYHRDNLIMGLGLAKGFLIADQSDNVRGKALQEQDLVFQRKLPFVQRSYVNGVKKMLLLTAYYLGANLDTLRIDVKIKLPHRLSAELLEQYKSAIEYVAEVKNLMLDINPHHKLTLDDLNLMVYKAGLDPEIINIPGLISQVNGGVGISESNFSHKFKTLSEGMKKTLSEKIGKRMYELLYEKWDNESKSSNTPNVIVESHTESNPYYIAIDKCELHNRLYECVVKEKWIGNVRNIEEPDVYFKRLKQYQKQYYLFDSEE